MVPFEYPIFYCRLYFSYEKIKIKTINPLCSSLFGLKIGDLNVKKYLDKCLQLSKIKNNKDSESMKIQKISMKNQKKELNL